MLPTQSTINRVFTRVGKNDKFQTHKHFLMKLYGSTKLNLLNTMVKSKNKFLAPPSGRKRKFEFLTIKIYILNQSRLQMSVGDDIKGQLTHYITSRWFHLRTENCQILNSSKKIPKSRDIRTGRILGPVGPVVSVQFFGQIMDLEVLDFVYFIVHYIIGFKMTFWPRNLTTFVDFAMNDLAKVGQSSSQNSQFVQRTAIFWKIGFVFSRLLFEVPPRVSKIWYQKIWSWMVFFRWIIFELDGCYVRFISIYACVPVVPLASPKIFFWK